MLGSLDAVAKYLASEHGDYDHHIQYALDVKAIEKLAGSSTLTRKGGGPK